MRPSPTSPRRQRRALYEAPTAQRRRRMTVKLSRELKGRFHRRSVPLRKGDTVRVLAGSFKGREERIAKVDRRAYTVTLDNVTLKSAEEKLKPLAIRTAYLVLTRLNLSDPWRRRALKVKEEELTPEERGELPETAADAAPTEEAASEPAAPEPTEPVADAPVAAEAPPKKRARPKPAEERA
jgi:large subunit ribosomal protein L24